MLKEKKTTILEEKIRFSSSWQQHFYRNKTKQKNTVTQAESWIQESSLT